MAAKKLTEYKAKRNFAKTPEPQGARSSSDHAHPIFVVQKHYASHLHYDFRLEMQGVLKSWAVPKGPPRTSTEKRLAILTEDHPIQYASFAGVIPQGEYGAGVVEIWDHGTFYNLKDEPLEECFKQGRIEVFLEGSRLKGPYALIRTRWHEGSKEQWLLLKVKRK
jgi:bifunctional non-homologous end joining protein LigD